MKRFTLPIAGVEHWHRRGWRFVSALRAKRSLTCRLSTAGLVIACAFAAGFTAAVWTIGMIVTAR